MSGRADRLPALLNIHVPGSALLRNNLARIFKHLSKSIPV